MPNNIRLTINKEEFRKKLGLKQSVVDYALIQREVRQYVESTRPRNGIDGINGTNGKDGSPDSGAEIVGKINKLGPNGPRINASQIDGLTVFIGGGGAASSTGSSLAIGSTVTGGTANRVLYIGSTGVLANSTNLTFSGTVLTVANVTVTTALINTALTSGRVPYITTAGQFTDSADLTFNGTSFVFNETGSDKDARFEGVSEANLLFTDASTAMVGIGTASPATRLHVLDGTGNIVIGAPFAGFGGIGFASTLSTTNFSLLGENANTYINAPTGGTIYLRIGNSASTQATFTAGAILLANTGGFALNQFNGASGGVFQNLTGDFYVDNVSATGDLLFRTASGSERIKILGASGRVGIGGITATSTLHIKAGTATANTAPLEFSAGTVETVVRAGIMEFVNSETGLTFVAVATRRAFVLDTVTQTITNKRITARIGTETSSATSTPTADTVDQWNITALAAADAIAAPTGTPTDGQKLIIRIKDNGTARALTYNAIYRAGTDILLPSTTTLSKTLYLGFIYNAADSKWDLVSKADGF